MNYRLHTLIFSIPAMIAPAVCPAAPADTDLQKAVRANDLQGVQAALAAGADANCRVNGRPALLHAITAPWHDAKPAIAYALLQAGATPEGTEQAPTWNRAVYAPYFALKRGEKPTPVQAAQMMEYALDSGVPAWAQMALECGADPNGHCTGELDPQSEGCTYLYRAIIGGECHYIDSVATARVLLQAGADPNKRSLNGLVPLQSWRCRDERISVLLDFGADPKLANTQPHHPGTEFTNSPLLHRATPADIPRLLAAGADPMQLSSAGNTALMHAETAEAVHALLTAGVPWSARNKAGETALHIALQQRHTAAVHALLATMPDHERDYTHKLLKEQFAEVVMFSASPELPELLLAHGATVHDLQDSHVVKALYYGKLPTVQLLMQHGLSLSPELARDALFSVSACPSARSEVIHFALQHGADVNALDADGRNGAMVALARRSGKQCSLNPDNLRALIAAGLNTRQRDRHGKTLADYAEELIAKRRTPMNRLLEIREILTKQAG
ncbi:MAG: ankyrin repeat domain-containing protein [Akkermansia sp.]|nr:ankyrin repeat domain-containing protein [Akkermansia sp.]